jgi:hypothetical protein
MQNLCTLAVAMAMILAAHGAAAQQCCGDCSGDGEVTVDEIVTTVNLALSGCPAPGDRFTDNADGTITDNWTGLMWEKKGRDGSIHDWENRYTWSTGEPYDPDGSAFTEFIATLNDTAFAGHTDWRVPTVDELLGILDYGQSLPATPAMFRSNCERDCSATECSCTASGFYWSSTTSLDGKGTAWLAFFGYGYVRSLEKTTDAHVRAVRGSR